MKRHRADLLLFAAIVGWATFTCVIVPTESNAYELLPFVLIVASIISAISGGLSGRLPSFCAIGWSLAVSEALFVAFATVPSLAPGGLINASDYGVALGWFAMSITFLILCAGIGTGVGMIASKLRLWRRE